MKRNGFTPHRTSSRRYAIIAILAAILFPVFAQAREKAARAISCISNNKQMSLASLMYAEDYDVRHLCSARSGSSRILTQAACRGMWTFSGLLQPYVKNRPLFMCPDSSRSKPGSLVSRVYSG